MRNQNDDPQEILQVVPRFTTGRILNSNGQAVGYCGVDWHDRAQDMICDITDRRFNYYSLARPGSAPSRITVVQDIPPYLRTEPDDNRANNLQNLPACSHGHRCLYKDAPAWSEQDSSQ